MFILYPYKLQKQGGILCQAGGHAPARRGEEAPEPHDLRGHPPQLPGALLRPGGGGHGAHPEE